MAAKGKAIILYRWFFKFVSTDEGPATGSQPNVASRSEVVSIYKCPQIFWGPSPNLGRKKEKNFEHFFRNFHTRHHIYLEQNNNAIVNLQYVSQKLTYFL